MLSKIKEFLKNNETKIVLVFGFILVAVLSFEAGVLKGKNTTQKPIIVKDSVSEAVCGVNTKTPEAQNLPPEASKNQDSSNIPAQNCVFLGSKNSNKYHLPNCRWAKNIKPENRVCFASHEDAIQKGYQPDKNCIK